jgi:hypothetical protein
LRPIHGATGTAAADSCFQGVTTEEPQMTDPHPTSPDDLDAQVDQIEDEADAMDRPDRAIPLPSDDEDHEGVGPVTGLVP